MTLCALMSVILGCDVCPGVVRGIGAKKLWDKMLVDCKSVNGTREHDKTQCLHWLELVMEKTTMMTLKSYCSAHWYHPTCGTMEKTLCSFVNAIVYQPTNECPTKDHQVKREYMTRSPPVALPKYLEEFKSDDTEIWSRYFAMQRLLWISTYCLPSVNHQPCAASKSAVCHLCSTTAKDETYCLPCYLTESLLLEIPVALTGTIVFMREELKIKWNFDHVEGLSIKEIQDAWEAYAICRDFERTATQVKFLVLPSRVIDDGSEWIEVSNVDSKFGQSFLLSNDISSEKLPTVSHPLQQWCVLT